MNLSRSIDIILEGRFRYDLLDKNNIISLFYIYSLREYEM